MLEDRREESVLSGNYIVLFIILTIFLITLGILVYFIRFRTDLTPSASSYNTIKATSVTNSYVFASPVRAKTGGDLIRITVFVLDSDGKGLFDKKVSLMANDQGLKIKEIQSLTDEVGRAIFDVGSDYKNIYTVEAFVDGTPLNARLKLTFD
jgi:flagellar basal body-associated protein FliL